MQMGYRPSKRKIMPGAKRRPVERMRLISLRLKERDYMSHSDGSIIVDTELDVDGFRRGSKELQSAVKSLNSQVDRLGPSLKKAIAGSSAAMGEFNSKAGNLEQVISDIERKMQVLAGARLPTEEYTKVCAELDRMSKRFDELYAKQEKFLATGGDTNSAQWQRLQYDMDTVSNKYHELLRQKSELEASGRAFVFGRDTSQYTALEKGLLAAKERLREMAAQARTASGAVASIAGAAKKLPGWLGKAAAATKKLLTANRAYKSSFSGVLNQIKRIAPALLAAEGVLGILRKAVNAYMQSNQQLSATLNSCWSGIGNLLGPIITRLVNLIATAVAYFTAFLRLLGLTGGAAVSAIGGAGGAAKKETDKLKRQLASFDDLNILSDTSSDDGGGGGGGAAGALPEKQLPDWAVLMAEQLKAGDWKGAAVTLTDKLNEMVENADWKGAGQKMGYYLNGALTFLATTIKTFEWKNLGSKLATSVNEILTSVDWKNLGTVLAAKFKIILETAAGFVAELDWYALANAIFDTLLGLWEAIDWGAVASGFFKGLGSAVGGIGKFLFEKLKEAFNSVRDSIRANAAEHGGNLIHGFFQGIYDAISGVASWIVTNIFRPFIEGFKSAFGIHSPSTVMAEQGGYIIEGLLQGITGAWDSILSFFSSAVSSLTGTLSKCWSSIKKTASSGWKKISTAVTGAWDGLKSKATKKWSDIVDTVGDAWTDIKADTKSKNEDIEKTVSSAWTEVSDSIETKITEAKESAAKAWENMLDKAESIGESLLSDVKTVWDDVKSNIVTKLSDAHSSASQKWDDMKTKATETGTAISGDVSTKWELVRSSIGEKLESAKTNAAEKWDLIRGKTEETGTTVSSDVSTAWSAVQSSITTLLASAKDTAANTWNLIKGKVAEVSAPIVSSVSTAWESVRSTIVDKVGSAKDDVAQKWEDLKTDALTWGRHICENIANGINNFNYKVADAAQKLAQKIKSFLGFSEPEAGPLSDFHTYMPDMVDLMVEGIRSNGHRAVKAVAEVAQAMSDEVQSGDYSVAIQGGKHTLPEIGVKGLSQLRSIASSVTYRTPAVASGGVTPYKITAQLSGSDNSVSDAVWASNDALGQTLVRVIMEAAMSVITAIQQSGGNGGAMNPEALTTMIINEINRRTQSTGESPLL